MRKSDKLVTVKVAQQLVRSGKAPAGMRVRGCLALTGKDGIRELPEGLEVDALKLTGCTDLRALPRGLKARRLDFSGDWNPQRLLDGVECFDLSLQQTQVRSLPETLRVRNRLELDGCRLLDWLPDGLEAGSISLRDCVRLEMLPEGLKTSFLDISGCSALRQWPRRATVAVGRLSMRGCTAFRELPGWLGPLAHLDLRDCANIAELPETLVVYGWIDLAGTGIRRRAPAFHGARLRWRGVFIDERIAFRPETITAEEVLAERNAERRRVLMERMGHEAFLAQARAKVLDRDRDAGGERRLLRVPLEGDEPLLCVSVICPSTGRHYMLRVPPAMKTCRQAVAWIAGFDNPDDYAPLQET